MNQFMQRVVTDGTGNAAQLDFTYSAGKTGTSTGPKDVWFMGFTGQYVTGVNVGTVPGQIRVTMGGKTSAALTNKILVFSAITNAGSISWNCISDTLKQRWCSSSCLCKG